MMYGINLAMVSRRGIPRDKSPLGQLLALINAAGGQSSAHDYASATINGGIWTSRDLSANSKHHTQATGTQRPLVSAQGALFDGVNDNVRQSISGGLFSFVFSFTKGVSSNGFLLTNQSGSERLRYQSANATAWGGATTVEVNGTNTPTRNALNTALSGQVVVAAQNISFTADTQIQFGRSGGSSLLGVIRWMIVLDHAALGSDLAAAVALSRSVAAIA